MKASVATLETIVGDPSLEEVPLGSPRKTIEKALNKYIKVKNAPTMKVNAIKG